jgi:hypothetical protein
MVSPCKLVEITVTRSMRTARNRGTNHGARSRPSTARHRFRFRVAISLMHTIILTMWPGRQDKVETIIGDFVQLGKMSHDRQRSSGIAIVTARPSILGAKLIQSITAGQSLRTVGTGCLDRAIPNIEGNLSWLKLISARFHDSCLKR